MPHGCGWKMLFATNLSSRCCVFTQSVAHGYLEQVCSCLVPRALKFKGPKIKCRNLGGCVLVWPAVGTAQICSSSPCDAAKPIRSKIIWQTQLMPVILLQNSSTNLFQASQIFIYPGKHQIVGFFASSEFCIDNSCFDALPSDIKKVVLRFLC